MKKLGLIAGGRELPAVVARNASKKGLALVVISVSREIDPEASRTAGQI